MGRVTRGGAGGLWARAEAQGAGTMSNRVRSYLIILVASVWAISFLAPIVQPAFKPAPELNVAFMAIIGVLTASYKRDENGRNGRSTTKEVEERRSTEGGDG